MISEKRYRVELETAAPLRIGGVEDPLTGIHNPVARLGDRVVVPGSSLKGALRVEIEQFLIDSYYNESSQSWSQERMALQPCIPATRFTTDEQALINAEKYRSEACHYPCEERRDRRGECVKGGRLSEHSICPVCYFLGAMTLPGFVRVPFLYAEISAEELYSARMDRARGTVVEGTNRPYQLIATGTKFSGILVVVLEDPVIGWKLGEPRPLKDKSQGDRWLEGKNHQAEELINTYIIERLQAIKILGGYKSKGFGEVKIEVIPLQ